METETCTKSITPDGLTGILFALEGMKKTIVLLNGPMGCRFYHSSTSPFLMDRPFLYLPAKDGQRRMRVDYTYLNDWFFRQERVPCTYLDEYDYVYSTRDKVRQALCFIKENIDFDILGIVNSPGAALIGDNLLSLSRDILGQSRVVMAESPGYSISFEEGYSEAAYSLLSQVGEPAWREEKKIQAITPQREKRVNLIGLSIWNRYWEGDKEELTRLFSLCGITLQTSLCADCSLEDLKNMPQADLNVVLDPEMGLTAARFLEETCSTPFYVCETLPIGFGAVEKMFRDICAILNCSCQMALEESEKARALAWSRINGIHQMYGKPQGVGFAVVASGALEKAFETFLTRYLGMKKTSPGEAELVFSNANVISELMLNRKAFCGIEIANPSMGYVDLIRKTHMGIKGSLFLVEQVLNGIMSRI